MGFNSDAQVADATQQIAKKGPAVGIWHGTRLLSFGAVLPPRLTMKPLEEALLRDYDVVAEFSMGRRLCAESPRDVDRETSGCAFRRQCRKTSPLPAAIRARDTIGNHFQGRMWNVAQGHCFLDALENSGFSRVD